MRFMNYRPLRLAVRALPWVCAVAALAVICLACERFFSYSLPMLQGDYASAAEAGEGGARALALHNQALSHYREHDYGTAKTLFEKSLAACYVDGKLPSTQTKLAAECQFFIGNCNFNTKETEAAAVAYEKCLELNPSHLYAKYNLEKLQEAQKSSGGGQNNDGKGPSSGPRKRI